MRRLVVAGVTSGVGKTTVACALMAAFRRRGLRVQPFKAGPDYIDPSHHTAAAGLESRNLDSVLTPPPMLQHLFARAAGRVELSVIEGVMGLFDGRNGADEEGSTAQIAKLLGAPVVVVIDIAKTSRTAGAVALGCLHFDPSLPVAGFILNHAGSERHAELAAESVERATGRPVFGSFLRDPSLAIPERHLGLVPAVEQQPDPGFFDRLADLAERQLDLDQLWHAAYVPPLALSWDQWPEPGQVPHRAIIAIAHDRAFSFYYADSLELLEAAGAILAPFSPLEDERLPAGTQGVYLGGGFPELYAEELAANRPMHSALQQAATRGLPIYGECGGLMYLGRRLQDLEGRWHTMASVLPIDSAMQRRRVTLGYRTATAARSSCLMKTGQQVMGHEFHYSEQCAPVDEPTAAYRLAERGDALEGYAQGNVLASYVHLHFGTDPGLAERFVTACAGVPST
jgi:cobyrinic acid a,c-diamide synthase